MIKLFESFRYGKYIFNNDIVEYVDELIWSDQIKIIYKDSNNKEQSVLLDNEEEFDELFKQIDEPTNKKTLTVYKVVYKINNKIIETIKDNIKSSKEAYSLANYLNKDFKYKIGTVKVIKYN